MNQHNYVRIREILLLLAPVEYTRNQLAALGQSTDDVENLIAPLKAELENLRNTTVRFIDLNIMLSYNRNRTLATVTGSFNRGASDLYCYSMFFFEITITHVPEFGGNSLRIGLGETIDIKFVLASKVFIEHGRFGEIQLDHNGIEKNSTYGLAFVFSPPGIYSRPTVFFTKNATILGKGLSVNANDFKPFIEKSGGIEFTPKFSLPFIYDILNYDHSALQLYDDDDFLGEDE